MEGVQIVNYDEWIGKSVTRRDSLSPEQLHRFEAMLNRRPDAISEGTELSMCAHWAYFSPLHIQSELTEQGYAIDNNLFPPFNLTSRLWTGGRIEFRKPLIVGAPAQQYSTIISIEEKEKLGEERVHMSLQHQISSQGAVAIKEDQHFMYRQPSEKGAHPTRSRSLDIDPDWEKSTKPNSILLFRFSALTFNSHRIHYDQDYARNKEGYPNIIVHGPLLLLLALEAFRSRFDGKILEHVDYQVNGPVYLGEEIFISGKSVANHESELRVCGPEKNVALSASIKWGYKW